MPTIVPGDYSPLTLSSVKTLGIIHHKYAGAGPQAWPPLPSSRCDVPIKTSRDRPWSI